MSIFLKSMPEIAAEIATRSRDKRLKLNLSQKTLSERSGVSHSTLKQFERSGKISLGALLNIALVLDELDNFEKLFAPKELPRSIDDILSDKSRKRGRK